MKLIRLLANLGYGSRKEVIELLKSGMVTDDTGRVLEEGDTVPHDRIRFDGAKLDPPFPLAIVLNKPVGFTCSSEDPGETVYDLLPARFANRKPGLNPIGRLDKDTSGLLLLTDDGKLLHRITHPKSHCSKIYHAILDRPLEGHEAERFGSGTLQLNGEGKPLLPAGFEAIGDQEALVTLHEGRYHQVRRMFAAVENHVVTLKRLSIGGFQLPADLAEGQWRELRTAELQSVFAKLPSSDPIV